MLSFTKPLTPMPDAGETAGPSTVTSDLTRHYFYGIEGRAVEEAHDHRSFGPGYSPHDVVE